VTSAEFKRWLRKQGCTFELGHGGHLTVRLGDKKSSLPMHGSR
jgi:mRNA interferase HicA